MKKKTGRRKTHIKVVLWIETIVCYMALLTIISYIRGPQPYELIPDKTISTASFLSFDGQAAGQEFLRFQSDVEGALIGYTTQIDLNGLHGLRVSFQIICNAEDRGNVLYVDFYNLEEGYDNPENEFQVILQEGENRIEGDLFPGKDAPQAAQLRIFTLNSSQYDVRELSVMRYEPIPKVTTGMVVAFIISAILLIGTIWISWRKRQDAV